MVALVKLIIRISLSFLTINGIGTTSTENKISHLEAIVIATPICQKQRYPQTITVTTSKHQDLLTWISSTTTNPYGNQI